MTRDPEGGDRVAALTGVELAAQVVVHLPDFVVLIDRERRYLWFNRLAPGLAPEDVVGKRMDDFIAPASLPAAAAVVDLAFTTGAAGDYEVEGYGDGVTPSWYRTRVVPATPADGEPRVLLVTRDITAERRAEVALRASESRFRAFLDGMPDYVIELDAEHRVRYSNRYHSAGSGPEPILGQRIEDLALPDMREEVGRKLDRLFATGEEVRWTSRSTVDPGHYVVRAVRLSEEPPRALLVATDVAREHEFAARLDASEDRLGRAITAGNMAIWEVDATTRATSAFGPLADDLGIGAAGVDREAWVERIHPEDRAATLAALDAHWRGETEQYEAEYRFRHPATGEWRSLLARARVVDAPRGRVLAGTISDVTMTRQADARKHELERQLERVQRLESVGILAGGIAHDFNNLLTVILATAEVGLAELDAPDRPASETKSHFATIAEAGSRAARLTQQLLAFSRRQELTRESVDVVSLVQGVLSLVRGATPPNVEVRFVEPPAGVFVLGDRGQLEQVLMNLVLNGRDAMREGGVLSLEIEVDETDVRILVEDTGAGIAPENVERIFEPFFTTKALGRGTGLGLSVAHGIVQQHHGDIRVRSEPGCGTEMTLRLPRLDAVTSPPLAAREAAATGHGTILLAEDEAAVRKVATRILSGAGYRVVAVEDGLEAVLEFEKHGDGFDLVLLDVMMPRLDGAGALRIRALRPGVPVLFCSGYSASADGDVVLGERLLGKPYRAADLLSAVRELLDASPAKRHA